MRRLSYEFLKSGLSINTHIGCSLRCAYCVLDNIDNFPQAPEAVEKPDVLIAQLENRSLFLENLTPIYVNNRTDPFLPEVIDGTYEVLKLLKDRLIKSPIILITKLAPDDRISKLFNDLNLIIIYTYTNLKGIDYNSNTSINKKNIEKMRYYVPEKNRFHYYRPIIPGFNDDSKRFIEALEETGVYFNTSIIGGVRTLNNNLFIQNHLCYNKAHKFLEKSIFKNFSIIAKKYNVNIVRHTSCAIAIFMNYSNKLGYFGNENHCNSFCKNYSICKKKYEYTDEDLKKLIDSLTKAKYEIKNGHVKFLSPISQEIVALLRVSLGIKVEANETLLSYSEKFFDT